MLYIRYHDVLQPISRCPHYVFNKMLAFSPNLVELFSVHRRGWLTLGLRRIVSVADSQHVSQSSGRATVAVVTAS
jgi:hypothetical protein